jgi:hypothetical protein
VLKDKVKLDTKFGFIKFENSEEAKAALQKCKTDEAVKALYHGG